MVKLKEGYVRKNKVSVLSEIEEEYYAKIFKLISSTVVLGNKNKYNTLVYLENKVMTADKKTLRELGFPVNDPVKCELIKTVLVKFIEVSKEIRRDQWKNAANPTKVGTFEARKNLTEDAVIDRNLRLMRKLHIGPETAKRFGVALSVEELKESYRLDDEKREEMIKKAMKDPAFVEQLRSYEPDLQVVVAFRMLPEVVWAMSRFGTFNVHAALLPQYRGAAPINWAIINGETVTGVTTFFLDYDIDTGRIILQKKFDIPDDADVEYVYNGLMRLGSEIAIETIDLVISCNGLVPSVSQDEIIKNNSQLSTLNPQLRLAPKLFKDNCRIDWNQNAKNIYDFVRGLSPIPTAWTTLVSLAGNEDGKSVSPIDLKIFKTQKTGEDCHENPGTIRATKTQLFVSTSDQWLEILDLQMAGKKRMPVRDFLNGFKAITDYHME